MKPLSKVLQVMARLGNRIRGTASWPPVAQTMRLIGLISGRYREDRCTQVAASLSFTTLLSLVPLLTVALGLFSRLPQFIHMEDVLRKFLFDNLLPAKAGNIVATYALQFSDNANRLTLIGSVILFVTAILTMLTIDHSFNAIWRVRQPRKLTKRVTMYGVGLVLGPPVIAFGMAIVTYAVSTSLGLVHEPPWLRNALYGALPILFMTGLLSLLYHYVPNCQVRWRHALPGAGFAALVFALAQKLFGLFIIGLPSYRLVYGAFAALPIFLLWLYLSWTVIILGALLTAVLPEFLRQAKHGP